MVCNENGLIFSHPMGVTIMVELFGEFLPYLKYCLMFPSSATNYLKVNKDDISIFDVNMLACNIMSTINKLVD